MGRLAGFSYREVTRKMSKLGFEFYRSAKGDHEIWIDRTNNLKTTIPHHREIKEGTLRAVLRQAKIDVDDFLDV